MSGMRVALSVSVVAVCKVGPSGVDCVMGASGSSVAFIGLLRIARRSSF